MNVEEIPSGAARVFVRGREWNVVARTPSADCTAVRLREIRGARDQTLLLPFDRLRTVERRPRPRLVRPRRWLHDLERARLRMHPFGGLRAAARAPLGLLPYQLEPAIAVLRDGAARLLIADKVGLGKTIQAGLILLELAHLDDTCRALVLVPAGLRDQWIAELALRLGLDATLADSSWMRCARSQRPAHVNPWALPGIYVTSHDLVKRPEVLRPLEDVSWDIVVVDEAHAATLRSDRRMAVHAIAMRSRRVVLLSATPDNGDPNAFTALCDIGRLPGEPSPILVFERRLPATGALRPRKTAALSVACSTAERGMHDMLRLYCTRLWDEATRRGDEQARLVAILLRKRALSSAASLAVSLERRLALLSGAKPDEPQQLPLPLLTGADEDALEDDEPVAGLAAPGLADACGERLWLTNLAGAAREAARDESKMRFLLRLLARVRRHGVESALIFTEYRDTLARLGQRLVAAGHGFVVLHGGLTASERSVVQREFNERGGIMLATDAAAEGLNLHRRCRLVIHYELPWNPTRLEQRCGRVDRLGQTARVHELAFVADHTAERLVIAPLLARARGAGPRQGQMLGALTESRVAAAVMQDDEAAAAEREPAALPSSVALAPADLEMAAVGEAARLEEARVWIARSHLSTPDRPHVPVSTLRRAGNVVPGLLVFVALEIRDGDGWTLHDELMAARLDVDRNARLLEVVSELIAQSTLLHALIAPSATLVLGRIAALDVRRRHRALERHHALREHIRRGHPAASRTLVQQGLFDRRTARAAASRSDSRTRQLEDVDDHRCTSGPLTLRAEPVAALLVLERA